MKKLQSMLCTVLLLVVCVMCVGCGAGKQTDDAGHENVTTTITLAEAETIILQALALDTRSGLAPMATDEGNRDIMEKLGNFSLGAVQVDTDVDTQKIMSTVNTNGIFEYHNHDFVTFRSFIVDETSYHQAGLQVETDEYLLDNKLYKFYKDNDTNQDGRINVIIDDEYANDYNTLKGVFGKEAFHGVYGDKVVKTSKSNGYSLTLQGDLRGYMYHWFVLTGGPELSGMTFEEMYQPYAESLKKRYSQAVIDACHIKTVVNFDQHDEITNVVLDLMYLTPWGDGSGNDSQNYNIQNSIVYTIAKTDATVEQPQWVTDYLAAKN